MKSYVLQNTITGLYFNGINFSARTVENAVSFSSSSIPAKPYAFSAIWQNAVAVQIG